MGTEERKDMTRSLIISDFRNLGVSAHKKNSDDRTFLKINRCLDKDNIGGLVILLGSNNSGKSNVLDAVAKYPSQEFTDDDNTDFIPSAKPPHLEMDVAQGKYGELTQPKLLAGLGQCTVSGTVPDVLLFIFRQVESFNIFKERVSDKDYDVKRYMNDLECQIRAACKGKDEGYCKEYAHVLRERSDLVNNNLKSIAEDLEKGNISGYNRDIEVQVNGTPIDSVVIVDYKKTEVEGIGKVPVYEYREKADEYLENQGGFKRFSKKVVRAFSFKKDHDPSADVILTDFPGGVKPTIVVEDTFSKEFGYNLSNRIYKYTENKIINSDLTSEARKPNDFITHIFSLLGYENKSIVNRYYSNDKLRKKNEEKLNERLRPISDILNKLLRSTERKYDLQIRLETEKIIFSISYGDIDLNLDHQSDGFRWMFGFFINFLMSNKFVAGDIVIMDEFGGLLNFGTVEVLSDILREFSKKHGITFIIATQNPMAIDISHLDEVRMVVPRDDGSSDILNDFTEFGRGDCTDALKPIVASMTVGRNFLRAEERATVFVENYKDYFYLNGFNKLFRLEVDFIPINGITEFTSDEKLAKALRSIERNPVLLVDKEIHNEQSIEGLKKNKVQTFCVSEIAEGKGTIFDLFSESDKARLMPMEASFDRAASLSYLFSSDEMMSDETKDNFRKFLENISLG